MTHDERLDDTDVTVTAAREAQGAPRMLLRAQFSKYVACPSAVSPSLVRKELAGHGDLHPVTLRVRHTVDEHVEVRWHS